MRRPNTYFEPDGGYWNWWGPDPKVKGPLIRILFRFGQASEKITTFENKRMKLERKREKSAYYLSSDKRLGLMIYFTSDPRRLRKGWPEVKEWKNGAMVARDFGTPDGKWNLEAFDGDSGECKVLVEDFTANEKQWNWLGYHTIVYVRGGELWQVDMEGEKTLVISASSFLKQMR